MPKIAIKETAPAATNRVFLVDDHDIVRFGLSQLISRENDLAVCGEAKSAVEALPLIIAARPDVVVTDISLRTGSGLDLVKAVNAHAPKMAILILTGQDELIWAEAALRSGARGYLMKHISLDQFIPAIRTVANGGIYVSEAVCHRIIETRIGARTNFGKIGFELLTDRELRVLQLLGQFLPIREIAGQLSIGMKAVAYYKQTIRQKLNIGTSFELNRLATRFYYEGVIDEVLPAKLSPRSERG